MAPFSATCFLLFIVCAAANYNYPDPTAEKERPPRLPEKKEGCPQECRCPVNPTCPPGSPLVLDTCGCGCKVCAVGFFSDCDGLRPCDATQNLTCHYTLRKKENLGKCSVIREYRSCFNDSTEIGHGDTFHYGCTARCVCDNGNFKCKPFCEIPDPPHFQYCTKMRLEKGPGQCCKHWSCNGHETAEASQDHLTVVMDPMEGSSPSTSQVDRTRCFFDGKEFLHGDITPCPSTRPEPVPGCVEMHLESVPGLCCKKWQCKEYEADDTQVSQEHLRELEARLGLNAPVVIRKFHSCSNGSSEIRHRQRFREGCAFDCECRDGVNFCLYLCPPAFPGYDSNCIDIVEVSEPGACCKQWKCRKHQHEDSKITAEALSQRTSEVKVDDTVQVHGERTSSVIREYRSCFNDGTEIGHGDTFHYGCTARCVCNDGNFKCEPVCEIPDPPHFQYCTKMRLEKVPGQCCKYWSCKGHETAEASQDRLTVVMDPTDGSQVDRTRCFFDGKEFLPGDITSCPSTRPEPVPGCVEMHLESGLCCKKWQCKEYEAVDTQVSQEHLRELEARLGLNAPVVIRKFHSCSNGSSEIRHRQRFWKGCAFDCECRDGLIFCLSLCPPAFPGYVPSCIDMVEVSEPGACCKQWKCRKHQHDDGKITAETLSHRTSEDKVDDTVQVHGGRTKSVIREYRSCFNNGTEIGHSDSFRYGCTARCVCNDGNFKCEPICGKNDPPLIRGCSKMRLEKEHGHCCESWSCKEYNAMDTWSSQKSLTVLKSIKKGSSSSTSQVDATRQSCFVDGKEMLHGQRFTDGCRHLCICANGSGLCLPLCPTSRPEPVPGCVEMHLETVPGLCCKKWKCKEYKAMDTQESAEDLSELEVRLSLNAPVVIRMFRSCFFGGSEIRHLQRFQEGCVGRCQCNNGMVGCVSLCPPYQVAPVPGCIDMRKVEVPGECCKQWKCLKYQHVEGDVTMETLYHRTSEDEVDDTVDDTVQVHGAKRRSSREAPHTADDTSVVQASSCNKKPSEWTPCSRPCGLGQSLRITYDPETCSPRAEKRLCMVKPCTGENSNASYRVRRMIRG